METFYNTVNLNLYMVRANTPALMFQPIRNVEEIKNNVLTLMLFCSVTVYLFRGARNVLVEIRPF